MCGMNFYVKIKFENEIVVYVEIKFLKHFFVFYLKSDLVFELIPPSIKLIRVC